MDNDVSTSGDLSERLKTFFFNHPVPIICIVVGILSLLIGLRLITGSSSEVDSDSRVVFQSADTKDSINSVMTVDVSGAVEKPGVYTIPSGSRIHEAILTAGGLKNADTDWIDRQLNQADFVRDGMKIYIPHEGEAGVISSDVKTGSSQQVNTLSKSIININNGSAAELDSLPGVGLVTAEKIIAGRPYHQIEELRERKIVTSSTFEKIKTLISTY